MKNIIILIVFLLNLSILWPSSVFAVNGDLQISNTFDGSSLVIKTTNRLAGAIDQITWKGKDFLISNDHGRSLQYAWFLNGHGECENPTEAGSLDDGFGASSSSNLINISSSVNQLHTISYPAYWLRPGETSQNCVTTPQAINTTITSDYALEKTVTIGYQGLNNVLELLATITFPRQASEVMLDTPIGLLTKDFSVFWSYDPRTNSLTDVTSKLVRNAWGDPNAAYRKENIPVILSTSDQQYAIGIYSPDLAGENRGERFYDLHSFYPPYDMPPNGIGFRYMNGFTPPGNYVYRNFVVIGNLNQVKDSLDRLYQLLPSNFESIEGYFNSANCTSFTGWSGLVNDLNNELSVSFYIDGPLNIGRFVGTASANISWPAGVCTELNGTNCNVCPANQPQCSHGFSYSTPNSIKDGKSHLVYAYGLTNTGHNGLLSLSPESITCPSILLGDLNNDGEVDIQDYNQLISDFGKTGNLGWISSDINDDGKVDIFDYNLLVGNFGR